MKAPYKVKDGALYFEDCKAGDLAREYGTPLYLMSETFLLSRIEEITEKFLNKYPGSKAVFASKAYQTLDMCRLIAQSPLGIDVVSGGELYTALKAGVDPASIYFHGNAKSDEELKEAVEAGVGRIVVDNMDELESLEQIAAGCGKKASILYRITPGVDSHTHRYISTAGIDSKFGIPLHEETRNAYIQRAVNSAHIELKGFHFHVGSQLMSNESHIMALGILTDLMIELKEKMDFITEEVNLGGGFGVVYTSKDKPEPFEHFTDALMTELEKKCSESGLQLPSVCIEPGRWICAEAGMTLYKVCSVKKIPGVKTWVSVDGGMGDNIRPALYQAEYEGMLVEKVEMEKDTPCAVAGHYCESSDILIQETTLPSPAKGDILGVFATGAYNYSMASNYNRSTRPAVVTVKGSNHRISVKRETYEDLIAREV